MVATFRAMATDVSVLVPDLPEWHERALARSVAALFEDTEQRFSRFRAESELSRLNAAGSLVVSEPFWEALQRARAYYARSDGWFDPTIGAPLVAAGYDRSFGPGLLDRAAPPGLTAPASLGLVALDPSTREVRLPAGVQLDFGGFLKGWTADRAAALLPVPCAVDAGGDAVLRGDGPDGSGWLVDVEEPGRPGRAVATLAVRDAAVATSGPSRRTWRAGGSLQHHLIDPRTARPARSDLAQVSVVAPTGEQADVLAKVTFLRGLRDGCRFLEGFIGVGGVLVGSDGGVRLVGGVEAVGVRVDVREERRHVLA